MALRVDNRISQLEREVRSLKQESDKRKWDEMIRFKFVDHVLFPMAWLTVCGVTGAGLGILVVAVIRRVLIS